MNYIEYLLQNNICETLPETEMEYIAYNYFKTFDNDELKIRFLEKLFDKKSSSELSMSVEDCAKLLVESGTFEGGQ